MAIAFEEAVFRYPGASRDALSGLNVSFREGELCAVVGPNGSGKSTLARLCDGLLVPSSGRVTVDGLDTRDETSNWEVRSRVGMVFQNPDNQIVGTVVEEDVAFGPENLGVPREEMRVRVDEALASVGLSGFEKREPHLLSEGQKQRLAVAGALAMRPRYLVLDEPTAMLDARGRADVLAVLEALAASGHGIVLVTHDLSEAVRADRLFALKEGRPAYEGTPRELFADARLLDSLGLALPPVAVLASELRRLGAPVPAGAASVEEIAEALWP